MFFPFLLSSFFLSFSQFASSSTYCHEESRDLCMLLDWLNYRLCKNIYLPDVYGVGAWLFVTQHIERYQLSEHCILSNGPGMQIQNISKWSQSWFYLQLLIFKLFEGFGAKTESPCVKMDLWIAQIIDSQILGAFFSKLTFHQSVMTSSMK